jgi:hypothetical protein
MKSFVSYMACALGFVGVVPSTMAVTMLASSFDTLCQKAQNRVHAKVIAQELVPPQDEIGVPRMCYELQIIAQLDNKAPIASNPRICYVGDLVSERRKIVGGLRYPVVGETAVLFINALNDSTVISPLQGYNQGHFNVQSANGRNAVFTAGGKALCGFDANLRYRSLDGEAADGLLLDSGRKRCSAISLEKFEERVRQCHP